MSFWQTIRDWLVVQQVRVNIGLNLLALINFALLVVTNSERFRKVLPIKSTYTLVTIAVFVAFLGMWLFGLVMDVYVRYLHSVRNAYGVRDPYLHETRENTREILERVKALENANKTLK